MAYYHQHLKKWLIFLNKNISILENKIYVNHEEVKKKTNTFHHVLLHMVRDPDYQYLYGYRYVTDFVFRLAITKVEPKKKIVLYISPFILLLNFSLKDSSSLHFLRCH